MNPDLLIHLYSIPLRPSLRAIVGQFWITHNKQNWLQILGQIRKDLHHWGLQYAQRGISATIACAFYRTGKNVVACCDEFTWLLTIWNQHLPLSSTTIPCNSAPWSLSIKKTQVKSKAFYGTPSIRLQSEWSIRTWPTWFVLFKVVWSILLAQHDIVTHRRVVESK